MHKYVLIAGCDHLLNGAGAPSAADTVARVDDRSVYASTQLQFLVHPINKSTHKQGQGKQNRQIYGYFSVTRNQILVKPIINALVMIGADLVYMPEYYGKIAA